MSFVNFDQRKIRDSLQRVVNSCALPHGPRSGIYINNEANLIGGENVGGATAATGADVTVAAADEDSGDPDPDPDRRKPRIEKSRTKSTLLLSLPDEGYVRLPQVLAVFPVSKSAWWAGIKAGKYPAGVKLSERTTAWRVDSIRSLIATFSA